jgi:hypothetical protein
MLAGVERRARHTQPRRKRLAGWVRDRFTRSPWPVNPMPWRDRWRWAVAHLLDRSSRTCWPDLVSWAMATREEQRKPRTRHTLREALGTGTCQRDALESGDCYCGKFTRPGAVVDVARGEE